MVWMLETRFAPGVGPVVIETPAEPMLYLDTAALRTIAEDEDLAPRFIRGLHAAEATLALSCFSLSEFSNFSDPRHEQCAGALIEAAMPRLFFINALPFEVINRENRALAGRDYLPQSRSPPFAAWYHQ